MNGSNPPNLILDWEEYQNSAYKNGVWAETFLKRLKDKTGIQGGIYGNSGDLSQMTQWIIENAWVWFAGYPYAAGTSQMIQDWNAPKFPYNKGKFNAITGWQFSSQPLDKSIFYLTAEDWNKLGGVSTPSDNNNIDIQTLMEDKKMLKLFRVAEGEESLRVMNTVTGKSLALNEVAAQTMRDFMKDEPKLTPAQFKNLNDILRQIS